VKGTIESLDIATVKRISAFIARYKGVIVGFQICSSIARILPTC
jgi:hypothetical protein